MIRWLVLMVAICLPLAQGQAQSPDQVRSVFKGAPVNILNMSGQMRKMSFGLTEKQLARIEALTVGQVQLGDVYFVDHYLNQDFSSMPGFSGRILPNVPPPVNPEKPSQKVGDPELASQWWIEKLGVRQAWTMATGLGVTVADCDAGFYHDEADLRANMLVEFKADLSDKEEPNVVDDGPYATHGTSVSAILAGVLDGLGTSGIAYNSKIVPLQNYNYDGSDDLDKEEATAACILKAVATPNVGIIVLENQTSNGSSETFVGTRDAVRLAMASGLIVVSAGGNYSAELIEEKNDNTGSIIVGALKADNSVPDWSNFGERITVSAYGERLHTLAGPNGAFADFGGTSGATPQVAATVALMKEINPMITPDQAREILVRTRLETMATKHVGGILQVPAAVAAAREIVTDLPAWIQQSLFREQLRAILLNP